MREQKCNTLKTLCKKAAYILFGDKGLFLISAIILGTVFIVIFVCGWKPPHWGIPLYIFLFFCVIGQHWRYLLRGTKSDVNEVGSVTDKQSRIALRADSSSPLYVRGYFRKNYNKNPQSLMAKLKGNYFCQIIALIQVAVMLIRLVYIIVVSVKLEKAGLVYNVLWPEVIIGAWVLINIMISILLEEYYAWILKQEKRNRQKDLYKEKKVCIKSIPDNSYEEIFYKNTLDYITILSDVIRGFRDRFSGEGYIIFGKKTNMKDNLVMDIEEDREEHCPQILIQMYQRRLTQEYVDMLNRFIHKEIRYASREILPFGVPHVIYIIYVEEKSKVFEDIFCGALHQRKNFYCLPIGVVLSEEKMYIPGIQKGYGYEEYQKLKLRIFEIFEELSLMYSPLVEFKEKMRKKTGSYVSII